MIPIEFLIQHMRPFPVIFGKIAELYGKPIIHKKLSLQSGAMNVFRFRRLFVLAVGTMTIVFLIPQMFAATPDEKTVLLPIEAMLDGMASETLR